MIKFSSLLLGVAVAAMLGLSTPSFADSGTTQPAQQQSCPVDQNGQQLPNCTCQVNAQNVTVCTDGNGNASIGVSTTDKQIGHFFAYPIGQSDKSVAKQVGNTVHNFFHHL